ncbi:unnamed protein product, partial [Didymodactylos carnosus]
MCDGRLCVQIKQMKTFGDAAIANSLGVDMILGMDWCRACK